MQAAHQTGDEISEASSSTEEKWGGWHSTAVPHPGLRFPTRQACPTATGHGDSLLNYEDVGSYRLCHLPPLPRRPLTPPLDQWGPTSFCRGYCQLQLPRRPQVHQVWRALCPEWCDPVYRTHLYYLLVVQRSGRCMSKDVSARPVTSHDLPPVRCRAKASGLCASL